MCVYVLALEAVQVLLNRCVCSTGLFSVDGI